MTTAVFATAKATGAMVEELKKSDGTQAANALAARLTAIDAGCEVQPCALLRRPRGRW